MARFTWALRTIWRAGHGSIGRALCGFTKRYGLKRLVYAEPHETMPSAILREKNVKSWPRAWRIRLITSANPNWDDLYETILQ
jgi:predicted GIY-YIG superfamily endonuclease